jgi:hypothetical protein
MKLILMQRGPRWRHPWQHLWKARKNKAKIYSYSIFVQQMYWLQDTLKHTPVTSLDVNLREWKMAIYLVKLVRKRIKQIFRRAQTSMKLVLMQRGPRWRHPWQHLWKARNDACFCPFCLNLTSFPTFFTLQDKR